MLSDVENCTAYCPTEQRGGWEAARKLLEREAHKRDKAAEKVSSLNVSRAMPYQLVAVSSNIAWARALLLCQHPVLVSASQTDCKEIQHRGSQGMHSICCLLSGRSRRQH